MALFRKSKFMSAVRALAGRDRVCPRKAPLAFRTRPHLEGLEERVVPSSTYTWHPTSADGGGLFQANNSSNWTGAIGTPSAGDSIIFSGANAADRQDCHWYNDTGFYGSSLANVTFQSSFGQKFFFSSAGGNFTTTLTIGNLSLTDSGTLGGNDGIVVALAADTVKVTGAADLYYGSLALAAGQTRGTTANFILGSDSGSAGSTVIANQTGSNFVFSKAYLKTQNAEVITQAGAGVSGGGSGSLQFSSGAYFELTAGTTWSAQGNTDWGMISTSSDSASSFRNYGTVNITDPGGDGSVIDFGVYFDDRGSTTLSGAEVHVWGQAGTDSVSYDKNGADSTKVLTVPSGSILLGENGSAVHGGVASILGALEGGATAKVYGSGAVDLNGGGYLRATAVLLSGGEIDGFNAGNVIDCTALTMSGGILQAGSASLSGHIEVTGYMTMSAGTIYVYQTWSSPQLTEQVKIDGSLTVSNTSHLILVLPDAGPATKPANHVWGTLGVVGTFTGGGFLLAGMNPDPWHAGGSPYWGSWTWSWSGTVLQADLGSVHIMM